MSINNFLAAPQTKHFEMIDAKELCAKAITQPFINHRIREFALGKQITTKG